jgi:hypothetical protein
MNFRYAIYSIALVLSTAAIAQSGTVTYNVNTNDETTVQVDYTSRTVTTTYTDGSTFTQVGGPDFDFDAAALYYQQTYSGQLRTPRQRDGGGSGG